MVVQRKRGTYADIEKLPENLVGELVGVHVIPRPAEDLEKVFPMLRQKI